MNILYLSAHEILEYDEVKLLTELGHNVFSLGAYTASNEGGALRGGVPGLYQNESLKGVALQCSKEHIHPEIVEWADVIISMHNARSSIFPMGADEVFAEEEEYRPQQPWIANNWSLFQEKKKRVIWRSIGQSIMSTEAELSRYKDVGLEIVRYSPKEKNIPGYCGEDALIRFYKDPEEFKGWIGGSNTVINFTQSLKKRGDHCGYSLFMNGTNGLNRKVYGPGNDDLGDLNGGTLTYKEQKEAYRKAGVYFYYGTLPASYTLTLIEAMMTGMPIVTASSELTRHIYKQDTNEIEEIIQNGKNGYVGRDHVEIKKYIKMLLGDKKLSEKVGEGARKTAIQLFGKDKIREEWREFLDENTAAVN